MSPVSRSRKPKKRKKPQNRRGVPIPSMLLPGVGRPHWFDPALAVAMTGTSELVSAAGPRELEEATARLVGARLHDADGLGATRYGAWTEELVDKLAGAVRDGADGLWLGAWYCLHGLMSILPHGMAEWVGEVVGELRASLPVGPAEIPAWLTGMANVPATGEAWRLVDAYGGRIGLVAGFRYPPPTGSVVYLLDFDVSDFPRLAFAGRYDDLPRAVEAWQGEVGPTAVDASPQPVTDEADLLVLARWDAGELFVIGDESRIVMDNWYRAQRRAEDLVAALGERGVVLPPRPSMRDEAAVESTVKSFTAWYTARHRLVPPVDAVEVLVEEWLEGALPGTERAVPPRRVRTMVELMGDWADQDLARQVRELLPEWIRWNAAETGLATELVATSIAAVADLN